MDLKNILNEDFFDDIDIEIEEETISVDETPKKKFVFEFSLLMDTLNIKLIDDIQMSIFISRLKSFFSSSILFANEDPDDIDVEIYADINYKNQDFKQVYQDKNKIELEPEVRMAKNIMTRFKKHMDVNVYNWQYQKSGRDAYVLFSFVFYVNANYKTPSFNKFKKEMLKIQKIASDFYERLSILSRRTVYSNNYAKFFILRDDYDLQDGNFQLLSDVHMVSDIRYSTLFVKLFETPPFDMEDNNTVYGPSHNPKLYRLLHSLNDKKVSSKFSKFNSIIMDGYRKPLSDNQVSIYFTIDPKEEYNNVDTYIEFLKTMIFDKISARDILNVVSQKNGTNHDIDIDVFIITKKRVEHKGIPTFNIDNDLKSK